MPYRSMTKAEKTSKSTAKPAKKSGKSKKVVAKKGGGSREGMMPGLPNMRGSM